MLHQGLSFRQFLYLCETFLAISRSYATHDIKRLIDMVIKSVDAALNNGQESEFHPCERTYNLKV